VVSIGVLLNSIGMRYYLRSRGMIAHKTLRGTWPRQKCGIPACPSSGIQRLPYQLGRRERENLRV